MQDSPICSSGMRILYRKIPFRPPDNSPFKRHLTHRILLCFSSLCGQIFCHSFYYTLLFSIWQRFLQNLWHFGCRHLFCIKMSPVKKDRGALFAAGLLVPFFYIQVIPVFQAESDEGICQIDQHRNGNTKGNAGDNIGEEVRKQI